MMNDYIDYYTYMNNLNQMAQKMPNEITMPAIETKEYDYDTDPVKGFIQGNMFQNTYIPYQNYKAQELNPANDQEYQLLLVQIYDFAAHDLELYLDVNPNDVNAIKLRAEYVNMYKQALDQYEQNFGPITETSQMLAKSPWAWNTKKWPWEGMR